MYTQWKYFQRFSNTEDESPLLKPFATATVIYLLKLTCEIMHAQGSQGTVLLFRLRKWPYIYFTEGLSWLIIGWKCLKEWLMPDCNRLLA